MKTLIRVVVTAGAASAVLAVGQALFVPQYDMPSVWLGLIAGVVASLANDLVRAAQAPSPGVDTSK